jgi:hypothetical protein
LGLVGGRLVVVLPAIGCIESIDARTDRSSEARRRRGDDDARLLATSGRGYSSRSQPPSSGSLVPVRWGRDRNDAVQCVSALCGVCVCVSKPTHTHTRQARPPPILGRATTHERKKGAKKTKNGPFLWGCLLFLSYCELSSDSRARAYQNSINQVAGGVRGEGGKRASTGERSQSKKKAREHVRAASRLPLPPPTPCCLSPSHPSCLNHPLHSHALYT